jgi:hypothetical protein
MLIIQRMINACTKFCMVLLAIFQSSSSSRDGASESVYDCVISAGVFLGNVFPIVRLEDGSIRSLSSKQAVMVCRSTDNHGHLKQTIDIIDKTMVNLLHLCPVFVIQFCVFIPVAHLDQHLLQVLEYSLQPFQEVNSLIFDV